MTFRAIHFEVLVRFDPTRPSSVTIPNVRYVLDFGFLKQMTIDPKTSLHCLANVRISQVPSFSQPV